MGKDRKKKFSKLHATLIQQISENNQNDLVSIQDIQPATPEQILDFIKIIDDAQAVMTKTKVYFFPSWIFKASVLMTIEYYRDLNEKDIEQNLNDKYWLYGLFIAGWSSVAILFYLARNIRIKDLESHLNFLPYLQRQNIEKKLEELQGHFIDSKEIQKKIEEGQFHKKAFNIINHVIDFFRFYFTSMNLFHFVMALRSVFRGSDSVLLLHLLPIEVMQELFCFWYKHTVFSKQRISFLKQLREWTHYDGWKELQPSNDEHYFFDLSISDTEEEMIVSLNEQSFKIPVKVFLREITTTFLQMGLPVIYFSNSRLIIHDWCDKNLKQEKVNLLHLDENLRLWSEIYANQNKKMNQLNYISRQLTALTPDHEALQWGKNKYRTTQNLPAIYFSTDVSEMKEHNVEIFMSILERIYGKEKVSRNENFIIVDGVEIFEEQINISMNTIDKNAQTIPNLEHDNTSGFYSKSQYLLSASNQNNESNNNNNNNNENLNKPIKIDEKILTIKKQLKIKFPNHVVVPLNNPKKDPGREFAIVEKDNMGNAMKMYPNCYSYFIERLKETSRVKSNNRGNGSSSTGMVNAIEPFRQLDGTWDVSRKKFKLYRNARVFFKRIKEEVIAEERVEIFEATGFNPKYHRGRK